MYGVGSTTFEFRTVQGAAEQPAALWNFPKLWQRLWRVLAELPRYFEPLIITLGSLITSPSTDTSRRLADFDLAGGFDLGYHRKGSRAQILEM